MGGTSEEDDGDSEHWVFTQQSLFTLPEAHDADDEKLAEAVEHVHDDVLFVLETSRGM